jgi:tRNA (guanine37-N1)-methyltransferase
MPQIDFVTLFPEMIGQALSHSMMLRAQERGAVQFRTSSPRDYCYDRHGKVDDVPFGGEPGMLMRAEPVALAVEALGVHPGRNGVAVVSTDPTGRRFDQALARELSAMDQVVFLCGHYEGIDQRVIDRYATHSVSIGDFVMTGGELPALVMTDAIVRLLPGVLGSEGSLAADSHGDGLLSAPNYTRPEVWRGVAVPPVLKSGNHQAIRRWRRREALRLTHANRPDLLARAKLDKADLDLLSS